MNINNISNKNCISLITRLWNTRLLISYLRYFGETYEDFDSETFSILTSE